ncbi:MAG: TetR/AcrR family transcriptional regulator [Gammaproteobacteria bacterium]|nr:TetR/AcrR family transcriptional regulator [Gammaproteobacteria bacterium]
MPKIAAANIEEHIRNQGKRILDAAQDLFTTRGYQGTDMADIAESMGLARNSLYRYYSNKDHILVAIVRRDMVPFFDQFNAIEHLIADPKERIDAWIGLQVELAAGPCNAMIRMLGEIPQNTGELDKEISMLHESPMRVLRDAVDQVLAGTGRDLNLVTVMIAGMVRAAVGVAMEKELSDVCIEELQHSIGRILTAG